MDSIENPVQLFAFGIAAVLSAFVLGHQFFQRKTDFGFRTPTRLPIFVGGLIALFAILSYIHNKTGESMAWLFSSEAIDKGLFEWLTVLCLLTTCVLAALLVRLTSGFQRLGFAALAIASFIIAGEEMSWGQWIFNWDTPEGLSEINLQNETNLHNLVNPRIYDLVYYAIGYTGLLGALLAYFRFTEKNDNRKQSSLTQLLTSAGNWLRDSQIGLVVTVGAATAFQHELLEEYAEFVLIFAVSLFVYSHYRLSKQAP